MILCSSTSIYAEDGKQLIENGRKIGKLVIIPGEYDGKRFENVGNTVFTEEYCADIGKIFKSKQDASLTRIVSKDAIDSYEEIDDEDYKKRVALASEKDKS